ncbi:MAG: copper-binding protein [Gammaproteobacteria bacterium]|nr:MAG: copper-binding protein [Gammaproteobacteria bacterium]
MNYTKSLVSALLGASVLLSSSVMAENHLVTTVGPSFKPMVIKIAPGDTVSWDNMLTHIVATMPEYLPAGAEGWESAMGESFTTPPLTVEGAYFYKCTPHWGMGMGGVIIVGNPTNLDDVKATKPKGAAKRLYKKAMKAMK